MTDVTREIIFQKYIIPVKMVKNKQKIGNMGAVYVNGERRTIEDGCNALFVKIRYIY